MSFLISSLDKTIPIIILLCGSLFFRYFLIAAGQRWISSFSHSATLVSLPIITYVITSVISGNIALSLGMVGALSIVRFRNPVKSPFELVVYFASITMGITASVSILWLILFFISIILVIFTMYLLNIIHIKFTGRPMFTTSFNEGNHMSTLEIESSKPISIAHNSDFLISETSFESIKTYVFASEKFSDLKEIISQLEKENSIISKKLNR